MKTYRSKYPVEAMRWTDTDANREAFSAWFEKHDALFETRGSEIVLPDFVGVAVEGMWIVCLPFHNAWSHDHGQFLIMNDEKFDNCYDEAIP